jgi:eukaryotic-like serine/threonine-protein kinase
VQAIPMLGGRYRLGPEIGSGGMGSVHRAWDERFEREVAIKVVRSGADRVERERLRREAQYLAHLDHPNLVAVLDAGEDRLRTGDTVWFAMELVSGPDLRTLLRRDGALDGVAVRRILAGVLAAIETLHTAGVIHRDLKPANVLLTAEPSTGRWDVKLVDLGIAHLARTDHLTGTGQIVGTAAYLSPEQVRGKQLGPASDVYSLGLVGIESLTGEIAFPGNAAESAAARLVRAPDLPAALDPAWRRVLAAMTAIDPVDRPTVPALLELVRALPDAALRADTQLDPTEVIPVVAEADALPSRRRARSAPVGEEATAVLAAPAMPVARGAAPGPMPRRRRQHVLAAVCVLAVIAAAAGWTAALSGGPQPTAAAAVSSAPKTHRATPTAKPTTPKPTATPVVTVTVTPTPETTSEAPAAPVVDDRVSRFEERLQRWTDRIKEHGGGWDRHGG